MANNAVQKYNANETPIIPKPKIADVRILKAKTIFEKQQPKHIITNRMNNYAFHQYNAEGLDKAYADEKRLYLDGENKTLFIAGTKSLNDWGDDLTLLPTHLTEFFNKV